MFYESDKDQIEKIFNRYENELKKRPADVGLITEYARWLAYFKHIDRAVEIVNRIDLTKLKLLTLFRLSNLWSPNNSETSLVQFTIGPLEQALQLEMTDEDVRLYNTGRQVMESSAMTKRSFREHLLSRLARRYVQVERYDDARKMYEKYLELPRREQWGDRTWAQKDYAEVLKKIGLAGKKRKELEIKAKESGKGDDWAEFAAYLQGQNEIDKAAEAWGEAIAITPATPRGFKTEHPKKRYRRQLIKMLEEHKMYEKEIQVLKDAFNQDTWDYGKMGYLDSIDKNLWPGRTTKK